MAKRYFNLKERDPLLAAYAKRWKKPTERRERVRGVKSLEQRVADIGIYGAGPFVYRVRLRVGFVARIKLWFEGRSMVIAPRGFWLQVLEGGSRELLISQETEFVLKLMGLEMGWWQRIYEKKEKLS